MTDDASAHRHLQELRDTAEDAADRALQKFFLKLGVDTSEPMHVLAMQKDFAYLRTWRESIDTVKDRSLKVAVTVIVTGVLGAIYAFFVHGRV